MGIEPYLGEISVVSFAFPPKGWALCNGQHLPINQNQALFALLGTTYGGNGQTTFALPNLQDRVPIHRRDNDFNLGQSGGEAAHTLSLQELPGHTHPVQATAEAADALLPTGNLLAATGTTFGNVYLNGGTRVAMAPGSNIGGSQPHTNLQPSLTLTFIIALQGIFPSQN